MKVYYLIFWSSTVQSWSSFSNSNIFFLPFLFFSLVLQDNLRRWTTNRVHQNVKDDHAHSVCTVTNKMWLTNWTFVLPITKQLSVTFEHLFCIFSTTTKMTETLYLAQFCLDQSMSGNNPRKIERVTAFPSFLLLLRKHKSNVRKLQTNVLRKSSVA